MNTNGRRDGDGRARCRGGEARCGQHEAAGKSGDGAFAMSMHGGLRPIAMIQDKCNELRKRACARREDSVWEMGTGCVLGANVESG